MTIFAGHITPMESFTILYSPFRFVVPVTRASNIILVSHIWISRTTFSIITTLPKFGSQCHFGPFRLDCKWHINDWACVMDIVYTFHILLIHFITMRTFDTESLHHSTYFLNISFNTVFYLLKNPKTPFLFTLLYLLHFCYIRVKGQHSRTCRVERSNLYSNTFLKWQVRLKRFRRLKTALNHYINFGLSSMSCYIPISWNIVVMILTDVLPVYL